MPGRPKHFDENQALEQAMELFREKGYDCTGISDLEKTLGLGRQSIYNTYGDKRSLFIKAFQHYASSRSGAMLALLKQEGSAEQKIDRFFTALIDAQCSEQRSGCLLANCVGSSMLADSEAAAIVNGYLKQLQQTLAGTLSDLYADSKERNRTAWLLVNTAQGICMLAKSGLPKTTLTGVKNQLLGMLSPEKISTS